MGISLKSALTAGTAIAGVVMVAAPSHAVPPKHDHVKPFSSNKIVVNKSIGGVVLNSTNTQAKKNFAPGCHNGETGPYCSYQDGKTDDQASVMFYSKTQGGTPLVGRMIIECDGNLKKSPFAAIKTDRGIHIDSTSHQVIKAYPNAKESDGSYYIQGRGEYETIFYISKGHVNAIFMQSVHFG